MIAAGVDVGSISTKVVIIDGSKKILACKVLSTGAESKKRADECMMKAIQEAGIGKENIDSVVSTGYGRDNVDFAQKKVTEIHCHAKGARFLFDNTQTILDIGGQDSKAIKLDKKGNVFDFAMNDKCAAGTGRFLEVMAGVLGVNIDSLSDLANTSQKNVSISNICTVFAESEVISLIHEGCSKEDIAKGIHDAVADRAIALLRKVTIIEPITLTGGVIKNKGVVKSLKEKLGVKVNIPQDPQIVGALGAAIIASEIYSGEYVK